jgi:hypothetical protein
MSNKCQIESNRSTIRIRKNQVESNATTIRIRKNRIDSNRFESNVECRIFVRMSTVALFNTTDIIPLIDSSDTELQQLPSPSENEARVRGQRAAKWRWTSLPFFFFFFFKYDSWFSIFISFCCRMLVLFFFFFVFA